MKTAAVEQAAQIIREGGIAAFPTETVYGLGADAFQPFAVARIFEVKRRPFFDPLIVHIARREDISGLVREWPEEAETLMDRFWPGPLTLVLPKTDRIPDIVTAGLPTVGIRMPRHPLALELVRRAGGAIAAPSANRFGRTSPTTAAHVREQLGNGVDFILDGGPCEVGVESTILTFEEGRPVLLRPGGTPLEEIEEAIGPVRKGSVAFGSRPQAPGMLERHYATHTPLWVIPEGGPPPTERGRWGLLAFRRAREGYAAVEILTPCGDLREAAARLFAAMRRLDEEGLDAIAAELVTDHGLGRAINDRLLRAAARQTA